MRCDRYICIGACASECSGGCGLSACIDCKSDAFFTSTTCSKIFCEQCEDGNSVHCEECHRQVCDCTECAEAGTLSVIDDRNICQPCAQLMLTLFETFVMLYEEEEEEEEFILLIMCVIFERRAAIVTM